MSGNACRFHSGIRWTTGIVSGVCPMCTQDKQIEMLKKTMQLHAGDVCSANNEADNFRGRWQEAEKEVADLQEKLSKEKKRIDASVQLQKMLEHAEKEVEGLQEKNTKQGNTIDKLLNGNRVDKVINAIERCKELEEKHRWIPTKERLP